ncbi:NepR family anti-sigma factor [Mesorhizobium shangrilense]|uniref:NepR family anti-sigma factor n=1 Tax=Mesorhizobium shangrilense TaxID=460060 RepID=A0ABV2DNR3_9HYPH
MKDMMKHTMAGAVERRRDGSGDPLGPNSEIGRKLKQYYDELVSDDVPDRFAQLLSQLEQAEPAQKKD